MIRMTSKQAREAGLELPRRSGKRPKAKTDPKTFQTLFRAACEAHGLPEPHFEVRFDHDRKWRFDVLFYHPASYGRDVALEINGGMFVEGGGRHQRREALLDEYEKLNAAQMAGYTVLLCAPQQVESGGIFPIIKRALEA